MENKINQSTRGIIRKKVVGRIEEDQYQVKDLDKDNQSGWHDLCFESHENQIENFRFNL